MSERAPAAADERSRHRQFEDRLLGQLRAKAASLVQGKLPADEVVEQPTSEGADAVRDELSRAGVFDRQMASNVGGTRSVELRFRKKALGGLFRVDVSRVRVRTIAPVDALLANERPAPATREDVLDALARYEVLPRRDRPSGVVLASANGFAPDARALVERAGPPTLILIAGRDDGGWDVALPKALEKTPWARLFDLESQDERARRLLYHLSQNAAQLDSRGISVVELSEKLGTPQAQTEKLLRDACRMDGRLMTLTQDGVVHVARTPIADQKGNAMSIWSRIRKILRMKPTVGERVREMTAQRVRLESERHELDQKTDALEAQERTALEQGAAARSDAERKQVAGKLMRVRTELKRLRVQAQNLTNALDVIGTHIHHLTLAEQGKRLELPKAEEITQHAAQAEQMTAEIAANADLARGIEVGAMSAMMQEEEAAIFEEFKQVAATKSSEPEPAASSATGAGAAQAGSTSRTPSAARAPASPPPVPGADRREATKPEMG